MKALFPYLFLVSISTHAQKMEIEQEKWSKEKLFCNSAVLSFRTKIFGNLKYLRLHSKRAINPLNHKTLVFDYYPLDLYHFRVNFSTEFDYSNYVVPWSGYGWSNGPFLRYDCEVRHLFAGAGVYYDFNYTLKKMNSKVQGKTIRFRIQPGLTCMKLFSSTTTYFYQNEMKLRLEKDQYFNKIHLIFRDEIRFIVVPRERLSFGFSIANLLNQYHGLSFLEGPLDFPTIYSTFGINFNFNFK